MKKTKKKVLKLLMNNQGSRDNDNKLIANFWFDELYKKRNKRWRNNSF